MPSLIDLRRRIRAVKNTEQITKAMKTVSASKLRRAQERIMGARPFAREMQRVLQGLSTGIDVVSHPLLTPPDPGASAPALLVVITADKGLCGGFNSALLRRATAYVQDADNEVALALVGRKGRDFFRRRKIDVRYEEINIFNDLRYSHAQAVAEMAIQQFTSNQVSSVQLLYNEFKSVIQQDVVVEQLLPIPRLTPSEDETEVLAEYLFEPSADQIFQTLLPRHVEVQIFRALLESAAAEHAARMTAMDAATRNAGEMIDSLTLHMNKVRQATITRELIEVVSGAQTL
ncbi:ATP synthase F1 subunit gamma [bacterium]|nr:MAG: ATP synthase F1 subunit gamma [bacterium]